MYYKFSIVFSTLVIGCLSLPVLLQQKIQISRTSPGAVAAGVGTSSAATATHLGGHTRPLGSEIVETRRTTTREVLGKLQEEPASNTGAEEVSEQPKSAAYIVGTGVIGTPVVVATPVVHTGLLHRSYPHVGVGIGRVDVTRTETNVITSGVY